MLTVIGLINSLLGLIPGNGWKTVIGFLLMFVRGLVPAKPELEPVRQVLEIIGETFGLIGVTHKVAKSVPVKP